MQQLTFTRYRLCPGQGAAARSCANFITTRWRPTAKTRRALWLGAPGGCRRNWPGTYPELELGRTATSIPALLFDLDGDPTDWLTDLFSPALPRAELADLAAGQSTRPSAVYTPWPGRS